MFASLASRAIISARGGGRSRVLLSSSTLIHNNTSSNNTLGVTCTSSSQQSSSSSNNHVAGGEYGEGEAKGYQSAKKVDFRERVELYTTLGLVGDASGKRLIDVACGTGWLTRALKDVSNAEYVTGTDLSPEMIALAKEEEKRATRTDIISYEVEDITSAIPGDFDIVTSNWLLVNARTRHELQAMCKGLASKAVPDGRLVTVVIDPHLFSYDDQTFAKKYGFEFVYPKVLEEGAAITIKCYTPEGHFAVEVENYYFPKAAYEEELSKAGFKNVEWHKPKLSPHPDGEDDAEYWNDIMKQPVFLTITATRGGDEL